MGNKMNLSININNIKSISSLTINLPLKKGLYGITGQNASGKSTLVTCAASAFFNMQMNEYFGKTPDDASISFELNGAKKFWRKEGGRWTKKFEGTFQIKGFYEGSVIFGNRFRNTSYDLLIKLDRVNDSKLYTVDEFIRLNLGKILHNNENYYEKILCLKKSDAGEFNGDIFYYQKGEKRVSQFHMSTGENLLLSILNSILKRNNDRSNQEHPCLLLLDEIELALHPSSLKRLVIFLSEMADKYNYAIYFSTHSIELISSINPDNIFFIEKHSDGSLEILNPCYPAYATRMLYDHEGYDYIIMVEDDLARGIVNRVIRKNRLINNKLIHVLPCGGYTNTIGLADEVVNSNLTGKLSKILVILDGDIENNAKEFIQKKNIKNNIPLNYLPIKSLEKFLKDKLFDNVDHNFFRFLNDFIFHQKSLRDLITEYGQIYDSSKDTSGKKFYNVLEGELKKRNKNRSELVEMTVDYLSDSNSGEYQALLCFLKDKLGAE